MKKAKQLVCMVLVVVLTIAAGCKGNKEAITLSETTLDLKVGREAALTVNNAKKKVEWSSDNDVVAAVTQTGIVTAVSEGAASISAKTNGKTFVCAVTVTEAETPVFHLDKKTSTIYAGYSLTVTPIITVENEIVDMSAITVNWQSSDSLIATVAGGKVTGTGIGTAAITANCTYAGKDLTQSCDVKVIPLTEYGFFAGDNLVTEARLLAPDDYLGAAAGADFTATLKRVEFSADGAGPSYQLSDVTGATFSSSDSSVAAISGENGASITLSSAAVGNAVITAQIGNDTVNLDVESWVKITGKTQLDKLALATWDLKNNAAKLDGILGGNYVLGNNIDYAGEVILPIASAPIFDRQIFDGFGLDQAYERFSVQSQRWKQILGLTDFAEFNDGVNPLKKAFTGIFDGNGYAIKNAQLFTDNYWISYQTNYIHMPAGGHFMGINRGVLRNISFEGLRYYHTSDLNTLYADIDTFNSRNDPSGIYGVKTGPKGPASNYNDMNSFVHANRGLIENIRISFKTRSYLAMFMYGTAGVYYNSGAVRNLVLVQEGGVLGEMPDIFGSSAAIASQYLYGYMTYLGRNRPEYVDANPRGNPGTISDSLVLTLMQLTPGYASNIVIGTAQNQNTFAGITLTEGSGVSNCGKFQCVAPAKDALNAATDLVSLKSAIDNATYSLASFNSKVWAIDLGVAGADGFTMIPGNFWNFG